MTRDQQRQLRELNKALPKIVKELIREKKIKKRDFMIFGVREELFFDCIIDVHVNDEYGCHCSTWERVKPLWLDDLFWDLFDMASNKDEPLSLRAIGAFSVYGATIYEDKTVLEHWSEEELRGAVSKYVDHFYESIKTVPFSAFEENLSGGYHGELREALYYIHNEQYEKALLVVGDGNAYFSNGDLTIYDAIRNLCREKLS